MTSIFKKAVVIASGQIEIERAPPGLAFLAGMCEHVGLEYTPLDLNLHIKQSVANDEWESLSQLTLDYPVTDPKTLDRMHEIADKFCDQIVQQAPDVIMISLLTFWQDAWCAVLLEKIKHRGIEATRLIGGPGASTEHGDSKSFGRKMAEEGLVDYWSLGEGENTLEAFLTGKSAPGLNHINDQTDAWAPQLDNLDDLPMPSYKRMDLSKYQLSYAGDISITGSRGCVRRCTFCDVGVIWKKFRFRSSESIIKEIEKHYLDTGVKRFFFTDSLINGSLKTFMGLLTGIVELKQKYPDLHDINYYGQFIVRPKKFHPESMYALMAESGYRHVQTGIESGSQRVRRDLGKDFSNEDVDYHMEMCHKYRLQTNLLMIIGYPTETREDFNQTLDMVRRYHKYLIDDTLIGMPCSMPFVMFKNTPAWHMAESMGIARLEDTYYDYAWVSDKNPELTVRERYLRYVEFYKLLMELRYPDAVDLEIELSVFIEKIKKLRSEAIARQKTIKILPSK